MEELKLKKGGVLIKAKWDSETEDYINHDVTEIGFRYLYDKIHFEEGLTLRDIFLFVRENVDFYNTIFGNWLSEYVAEAFSEDCVSEDTFHAQEIQYLELYFRDEIDGDFLNSDLFPGFHGIGVSEEDNYFSKKGETIQFGVDFAPIKSILDLPVILSPKKQVLTGNKIKEYSFDDYTLGGVLHGIFWEISFFGSPEGKRETVDSFSKLTESVPLIELI